MSAGRVALDRILRIWVISHSALIVTTVTGCYRVGDRFWRNGLGAGWHYANIEVDADYQLGNDSAADVYGDGLVTSGGFLAVRQALTPKAFAIARWDATSGPALARTVAGGVGYRVARNMRLTLFETGQRDPKGTLLHIISSSLLFAY